MFVFGCRTGFGFSDLSSIHESNIRDGMLHIVQKKTSSMVIVPLREDARRLLIDKYGMKIPAVSILNLNYYIKEVARFAGFTAYPW